MKINEILTNEMTLAMPNIDKIATNQVNNNKQYILDNGEYFADIEEFKVLKNGNYYSLWTALKDNKENVTPEMVAGASINDANLVEGVWVSADYRGKKLFSKMLWFFLTRLGRSRMILGNAHSSDMREVIKGLSKFKKSWYNTKTNEIEPFDPNNTEKYYSVDDPTDWRLVLENSGNYSDSPKFNSLPFPIKLSEIYELYID